MTPDAKRPEAVRSPNPRIEPPTYLANAEIKNGHRKNTFEKVNTPAPTCLTNRPVNDGNYRAPFGVKFRGVGVRNSTNSSLSDNWEIPSHQERPESQYKGWRNTAGCEGAS